DQGTTTPVLGDVAKQAVFDHVPFTGARWKVAHADAESRLVGQALELRLPQSDVTAVTATAVGADQQLGRGLVQGLTQLLPPVAHTGAGKGGRSGIEPDPPPALMGGEIVDPVRNGLAGLSVQEVVPQPLLGRPGRLPLAPAILEVADEFFLLTVDRDH